MDQKVLMTVVAGGIELEIVKAFAPLGSKVFVCDINAEALNALEKAVPGVELRFAIYPAGRISKNSISH